MVLGALSIGCESTPARNVDPAMREAFPVGTHLRYRVTGAPFVELRREVVATSEDAFTYVDWYLDEAGAVQGEWQGTIRWNELIWPLDSDPAPTRVVDAVVNTGLGALHCTGFHVQGDSERFDASEDSVWYSMDWPGLMVLHTAQTSKGPLTYRLIERWVPSRAGERLPDGLPLPKLDPTPEMRRIPTPTHDH